MKYLGETVDIHTGGIDHIPVHHTNEIAQSEAATGKKFVNYWLHYNFLQIDGQKMSKSLENIYTVEDIKTKGFDPIALRYLFLTAHYRDMLNFTWEALEGAQNALNNLRSSLSKMIEKKESERTKLSDEKLEKIDIFSERFKNALSDDLNTPQAVAVLWEMLKSNIPTPDKVDMLYSFDEILGLGLRNVKAESEREIPQEVLDLMKYRMELRSQGRFDEADKIRAEIEKRGYTVNDTKINA
jgi:cysteinyl-tRNA synthetase